MSNANKNQKSNSLLPLLNDLSDESFSSIPFADDDSAGIENESHPVDGHNSLNRNMDLSVLVHLSESDREQSDSKLNRKKSTCPAYLPGFIIKVHDIAGSLRRNSISLPTGLNDRVLDALQFQSHIPNGGRECEDIHKHFDSQMDVLKPGLHTADLFAQILKS